MEGSVHHLSKNGCFLSSAVREEEMESVGLSGMQLKFVQFFFRHGARTPIKETPGVEEITWDKDSLFKEEDRFQIDYEVFSLDGRSGPYHSAVEQAYKQCKPFKGGASVGQLTTRGMNQCYQLGSYLRKHYANKLQFLPSKFNNEEIYLRSTNISRNLKSMSCLLAAMYGEDLRENATVLPMIHTDHSSTEILYPNYQHSKPLMNHYYHTIKNTDVVPGVRNIRLQVQALLAQDQPKPHLDMIGVRDGMSARQAHDLPVPPILEPLADVIERAAVDIMKYGIGGVPATKHCLPYAIGPLLGLIVDNIERVITGESCHKFHVYSCHDTTILPLLIALDVFDDTWPGLCADLIYELYEDGQGHYYVRILYLGKELKLGPNDNNLLPLDEFKDLVSHLLISKEKYQESLINVDIL